MLIFQTSNTLIDAKLQKIQSEMDRDLRDSNNITWNIHILASFLCPLITHPIIKTIYKAGWHLPFRGTVQKRGQIYIYQL